MTERMHALFRPVWMSRMDCRRQALSPLWHLAGSAQLEAPAMTHLGCAGHAGLSEGHCYGSGVHQHLSSGTHANHSAPPQTCAAPTTCPKLLRTSARAPSPAHRFSNRLSPFPDLPPAFLTLPPAASLDLQVSQLQPSTQVVLLLLLTCCLLPRLSTTRICIFFLLRASLTFNT